MPVPAPAPGPPTPGPGVRSRVDEGSRDARDRSACLAAGVLGGAPVGGAFMLCWACDALTEGFARWEWSVTPTLYFSAANPNSVVQQQQQLDVLCWISLTVFPRRRTLQWRGWVAASCRRVLAGSRTLHPSNTLSRCWSPRVRPGSGALGGPVVQAVSLADGGESALHASNHWRCLECGFARTRIKEESLYW